MSAADREGPQVPVQIPVDWRRAGQRRTVPLRYARRAYEEYARQYGEGQSFDRLHERGGFGATELMSLLCDAIDRLEARTLAAGTRGGR